MEYGNCNDALLFNWLHWRKWIYDIDNRSAQETGYVFEPIIRSCLGGESISHARSPVKRLNDQGQPTTNGRQIDCYIEKEEGKFAYELKLRVTIAASGQGRFNEELTFPKEAKHAGITPVLIVLDPTPSGLLTKLIKVYEENAGLIFIGEAAWKILIETSGEAMGKFIEKYIEPPIKAIEGIEIVLPSDIVLSATEELVTIKDAGSNNAYSFKRIKKAMPII
ncbi:hypothetical protein E4V51_12375 [Paenibacillus sp. 28ISP30-2]|nr:hypothetical protein [Paenibacillus sp. 28ISP30-2]